MAADIYVPEQRRVQLRRKTLHCGKDEKGTSNFHEFKLTNLLVSVNNGFPLLRLQTAPPRRRLVPEESRRGKQHAAVVPPLPLPVRAPAVTAVALLRVPCVLAHPVRGASLSHC